MFRLLTISLLSLLLLPGTASFAQDLRAEYDSTVAKWREAAVEASVAAGKFMVAKRAESDSLKKRWQDAINVGNAQLEKVQPIAIKLFDQTESPDDDLYQTVMRIMEHHLAVGNFSKAAEISDKLYAKKPADQKIVERMLSARADALIFTNRFAEAAAFKSKYPGIINEIDSEQTPAQLYLGVEVLQDLYEKELVLQKSEAEADDLPRVEIKTTKGTFVIELFENEAPESVANFIFLIEECRSASPESASQSAYDGMVFHRVIDDFMAQTGGYNSSGLRAQIGWSIYDEYDKPNARMHFRGSVSMAKTNEPNSGNSQFFITFVPYPALNGRHTVFGRVISGMESVDRLNRTHYLDENHAEKEIEGIVRDQIISVRVLRKRDHDYKPRKVE